MTSRDQGGTEIFSDDSTLLSLVSKESRPVLPAGPMRRFPAFLFLKFTERH